MEIKYMKIKVSINVFFLLSFFCLDTSAQKIFKKNDIENISSSRALMLDNSFLALVNKHKINTAAVAVIKNRKVIWENHYGQQSPGTPASENTLFNIASLTKTVTAETILRLVAQGKLSLDEPIAPYWIDPDLKGDPNIHRLTARMLLTHTSGFMNWRYFSDDRKLSFIKTPGTTFGYSGEGFEYLAKYAEKKLGTPFEQLVQSTVFDPVGMDSASISVHKKNFSRIAKPLDENGKFYGYYCHPSGFCQKEGSYSAAANLVITIADYAKLLISSMEGEGLNPKLEQDRNTMQGIQFTQSDIDCSITPDIQCPTKLGYGLGWSMSHLKEGKLIGHRGTNWSVVSIAYYYQDSGDGLVIFFNAPNKAGIAGMIDALNLLDPDSPEIPGYKLRLARTN
jgi:CubicO group peptidase (beta-lactamase class C family)